jgi:hypothetical protein
MVAVYDNNGDILRCSNYRPNLIVVGRVRAPAARGARNKDVTFGPLFIHTTGIYPLRFPNA